MIRSRFPVRRRSSRPGSRLSRHLAPAAFSVGAGIILALAASGTALGLTACRSDPTITLSNGTTLTIWESIGDTTSDVKSISYQVHLPQGVSIKSVTYTGNVPATLQSIKVYADENPGNYDTYSAVVTGTSGMQTDAYLQANNSVSAHTTGPTPNPLHNHLHVG